MKNNEVIKSKENKNIKYISKLSNSKFRSIEKCFVSYDLNVINKACDLGLLKAVYLTSSLNKFKNEILISEDLMKKLNKSSNIIGIISFLKESEIKEDKVVYLDEIRDPINLAKIIYLMKKFSYKRLILSNNSVSIYNQKCVDELLINIFDINISYGDSKLLNTLKERGYGIYSTGLKSATLLSSIKEFKKPYVIVFGNEARGVKTEILDMSSKVIKIEMSNMESLNVAVAASIIFNSIK